MSTTGRKITPSDLDRTDREHGAEPESRMDDMPVREFLEAGARRGLTTERMFPDDAARVAHVPGRGARPTP